MDNAGYTSLTRQSGLLREMQIVANNIANISTTGFQKEGLLFAEYVHDLDNGGASLSMANADVQITSTEQGPLSETRNTFDLAIEGGGYFLVQGPEGSQLTRAGNFGTNAEGELVASDGARVMDDGQAAIVVPPDAKNITISADGTLSADGNPLGQIGVFLTDNATEMSRHNGVRFEPEGEISPVEDPKVLQGFLEGSNVNPVLEITRMIEVQHAYEMGQKLMDQEDQRIRNVLQTLGK